MEHRCGNRHPLRTLVVLHTTGGIPVRGHTREVSISGMFVDVAPEHFSANSVIDIELTVPGTTGLRRYRWQAMVVRRTGDGVGLMFDRLRPPAIGRLMAIAEMDDVALPSRITPLHHPGGRLASPH
jgi:hypothetical protein